MVGSEQVVEKIPSKTPKWIEVPFAEKGKRLLFKGEASSVHDSALGLRQAKANAIQNMVEAIRIKARSEFSEAVRGVNTSEQALGQYLDSVVAWTTDNIEVSGIQPQSEYREKLLVRTPGGVEYRYNCFVRLAILEEDYMYARQGAVDQALAVFQDEEARRLALEAKEKLER
ncbi:MAG: hypothetical protein GTO30_05385 [Acidobacteria bacterium]|nr:hypothetical protein [Acidobacteriota bacterium]